MGKILHTATTGAYSYAIHSIHRMPSGGYNYQSIVNLICLYLDTDEWYIICAITLKNLKPIIEVHIVDKNYSNYVCAKERYHDKTPVLCIVSISGKKV